MAEAGIDSEVRKMLTGHSIGVEKHYLDKTTQSFKTKLLNEYKRAIPFLTINKQQHHVIVQTESEKDIRINQLEKQMEEMQKVLKGIYARGVLKKD